MSESGSCVMTFPSSSTCGGTPSETLPLMELMLMMYACEKNEDGWDRPQCRPKKD